MPCSFHCTRPSAFRLYSLVGLEPAPAVSVLTSSCYCLTATRLRGLGPLLASILIDSTLHSLQFNVHRPATWMRLFLNRIEQPSSRGARSTQMYSHTAPLPWCTPVQANPCRQASIALSHAGGGMAIHAAYPALPDLTDFQADLSSLYSDPDRIPRSLFPPTACIHPDPVASAGPSLFEHGIPGGPRYRLLDSTSNPFSYPATRSTAVEADIVTKPPTSQLGLEGQTNAPWTHLCVAQRRTPSLSTGVGLNDVEKPEQIAAPVRHRAYSSASGQQSFRDSAYGSGSGISQHEVESVNELPSDAMDQSSPLYPSPSFHQDHVSVHNPPRSSAVAPGTISGDTEAPSFGQTIGTIQKNQTQKASPLLCRECKYIAKTRSDLKYDSPFPLTPPQGFLLTRAGNIVPGMNESTGAPLPRVCASAKGLQPKTISTDT